MAADERFTDYQDSREDGPVGTRSEIITGPVSDWATDFSHLEPEWAADPYPIQDDLRQRCPIAHTERFGGEPPAIGRGLRQVPQRGADRAPGRVDAGDEQQGHRADHVGRFELAAVQLRVDEVAGEVPTRVVEMLVDLREEVFKHPRDALDALIRRQVDALQQVLDELAELRPVLRGEAEHVSDDPHRDVLRVVSRGVHYVPLPERVD